MATSKHHGRRDEESDDKAAEETPPSEHGADGRFVSSTKEPVKEPPPEIKVAEAAAIEAEAAAVAAAAEVERQKRMALVEKAAAKEAGKPQTFAGDVKVMCIKDNPRCSMGPRNYHLERGKMIMMHPSHATELEQNGWVLRRG